MIQLHEDNTSFDCCIRMYRRAILNTLIQLHPTTCLEIGTHIYQTSRVFSYYFEKYQPDGALITADIATCGRATEPPSRVWPVMVWPHIKNSEDYHGGIEIYHKKFDRKKSLETNIDFIMEGVRKAICGCGCHDDNQTILHFAPCCDYYGQRPVFDFVFVDGDHTRVSIEKDLQIAKSLTKPDGFILIDDILDRGHEQYDYYQTYLKNKNKDKFYEYVNWFNTVGMGLIRAADLEL